MLPLFLIGGLMLLLFAAFRRKASSSTWSGTPQQAITQALREAGYSDRAIKFWIAVSNFETAKWTSNLCIKYNNLFGMKQPMKRFTLSIGPTPNGFASFDNWLDSAKDLTEYMKVFDYPKDFDTLLDQVSFMKSKGYFEEPLDMYYTGVKSRMT